MMMMMLTKELRFINNKEKKEKLHQRSRKINQHNKRLLHQQKQKPPVLLVLVAHDATRTVGGLEAFRRQVAHDIKKLEIYEEFEDAARKGCADDLSMSLLDALRLAFNGGSK